MIKNLRLIAIAAMLVVSSGQSAHASWFDDGLDLIKRAANYTRNNPKSVVKTGLFIAAVSCVAFVVYKNRAEPRGAMPLEIGDWEDIPFIETPVGVQTRILTPAKAPKLGITARSPELKELIADALSRRDRIVGLNSQAGEH